MTTIGLGKQSYLKLNLENITNLHITQSFTKGTFLSFLLSNYSHILILESKGNNAIWTSIRVYQKNQEYGIEWHQNFRPKLSISAGVLKVSVPINSWWNCDNFVVRPFFLDPKLTELADFSILLSLLGFYPETWQVCKLSINLLNLAGSSTNISA